MINFFIFILITAIIYNYLKNIETFGLKWEDNDKKQHISNNSDRFINNYGEETTTTTAVCLRPNLNSYNSKRISILDKLNKMHDLNSCSRHNIDWETARFNKLNKNVDKIPQIYNCLTNEPFGKTQQKIKNIFYKSKSKKINNTIVPEKYIKVKIKNTNQYLHLKNGKLTFKKYNPIDLSEMNNELKKLKESIKARFIVYAKALQDKKKHITYYWDNQCSLCPAHLYGHCSKGGTLIGERGCGVLNAGCEGKCQTGTHYNPIIIRTNNPNVHLLMELKQKKEKWNKTIFNLRIIGMKEDDLNKINMNNDETISNINSKLNANLVRENLVKNFTITGNIETIINNITKIIDAQIVNVNLNKNQTSPFFFEFLTESETGLLHKIVLDRFAKIAEDNYYKLTFNKLSRFEDNNFIHKLTNIKVKSKAIDEEDKIQVIGYFGKEIIDTKLNIKNKNLNSQVNISELVDLLINTNISDDSFPNIKNNTLPNGNWKQKSKDSRLVNGNNVLETTLEGSSGKKRYYIHPGISYNNVNGTLQPTQPIKLSSPSTYLLEALEFEDLNGTSFTFIKPTDLLTSYVCNIPNSKNKWIDKKDSMEEDQWSNVFKNINYEGGDIGVIPNSKDIDACKKSCFENNECIAISYETITKNCYPKYSIGNKIKKDSVDSYTFKRKASQRKGNFVCPKDSCYNPKLDSCINPPTLKLPKKCDKQSIDNKLKKAIKRKFNEASDDQYTEEANRILSELSNNDMKITENKFPPSQIKNLHKHLHDFHKNSNKKINKPHNKK